MPAQALHTASSATRTTVGTGRITEIIQHSSEVPLTPLLLPMLAQLSQAGRWLALVAPPSELDRENLRAAGVQIDHLWILRPDAQYSREELAARALSAGTCHTVVSWHPEFSELTLQQLQQAAAGNDALGIVVRGL